jgi:DNA-binding CsgD family transcriptional regulator
VLKKKTIARWFSHTPPVWTWPSSRDHGRLFCNTSESHVAVSWERRPERQRGSAVNLASDKRQADPAPRPCCCHADHLTDREVDVLCHLAAGLSNKEVAEAMHLSEHTVAGHVRTMLRRTEARTRSDLIFRACVAGLLELTLPPRPNGRRCVDLAILSR